MKQTAFQIRSSMVSCFTALFDTIPAEASFKELKYNSYTPSTVLYSQDNIA